MPILSISSRVVQGYVGNSAIVPGLQSLGFTVWPLDTVVFSNHPGHGRFRGTITDPAHLLALLEGLQELGVLVDCQAVLSGYLGHLETADVVAAAVTMVEAANPNAFYCCDPVIGDDGRNYVDPAIVTAIIEKLLPRAHIVTPNYYELSVLSGVTQNHENLVETARGLPLIGPKTVVVSGHRRSDMVRTWAITPRTACWQEWPWRERPINGAGDLLAALFLGYWLADGNSETALAQAVSRLAHVIDTPSGDRDLDVITGLAADGC